jgi:hypothetical protein
MIERAFAPSIIDWQCAQPRRSGAGVTCLEPSVLIAILGGPICAEDWSWWRVRTASGAVGWVSEGGDDVDPYFICPVD